MDSTFVPSLIELRQAKPEDVIAKLHAAFLCIAKMDADEIVAAYQTLMAVAYGSGLENDSTVKKFQQAMENQMIALAVKDNDLLKRFTALTNKSYTFSIERLNRLGHHEG